MRFWLFSVVKCKVDQNYLKVGVIIIQPCLPHYRIPFFAELNQRMARQVVVLAGPYSMGGSPVSAKEAPGINWIQIENVFLGNQFIIQKSTRLALEADIAVLSFNARNLSNLILLIRRKQLGLPVILWGHGISPRPNSPNWVRRFRAWMAHQADAVIFYSDEGRRCFVQLGLPQEKLFVAHNSIDVESIRQTRAKFQAQRQHIFFIGRLIASKKADLLLEAFKRAKPQLPTGTHLIIVGDGPEKTRLESLTQAAQLSQFVEFMGEMTEEADLAPLFARSAVCVSPGYVGLSAIHSLAYGVPLLIADNEPHSPEIEAFVPNENGEYFASNDPDSLAQKLINLMSCPKRLEEMGNHGQDLVESRYSIRHMVDVFSQAFGYALRIGSSAKRTTAEHQ